MGYSLGMVKMEAFDDSYFMPQVVRVGLTDHTGSIVSSMACPGTCMVLYVMYVYLFLYVYVRRMLESSV